MQIKMTLDIGKAFAIFNMKGLLHVCFLNKLVKR